MAPTQSAASDKTTLLQKEKKYDTFDRHSPLNDSHPVKNASCFSKLLLSWCYSIMKIGNERQLHPDDAWPLLEENKCKPCTDKLNSRWDGQVSIVRTLSSIYLVPYISIGFMLLASYFCDFLGPVVLQKTVELVSAEELDWEQVSLWLGILAISRLVKSVLLGQFYYQCQLIMLRVTSSMKGFVYRKSLRLNSKAKAQKSTGDIVNIYTTDVNNIISAAFSVHSLWVLPIIIAIVLVKLYSIVGNATFVGVGTIITTLVFNKVLADFQVRCFDKIMKIKDERMKTVNEIFGAVQIVKLNAWEDKFREKLSKVRARELEQIWGYLKLGAINITLLWGAPVFVTTATFATYALWMGQDLTASTVFTAIALFRLLQEPLRTLPQCITNIIQAGISIKRLKEFSELSERDSSNVQGPNDLSASESKEYTASNTIVSIQDGTFSWDSSAEKVVKLFDNFNFTARRGELVVVHGKVASGKSSLCSILLGDMDKLGGSVYVGGKIAYCPQQSWIQNLTIRDNITFGSEWDSQKYKNVIKACGLTKDLRLFANGDMTEIGEKGLNLSGGQKARISIARACYSDADIFIFDSPLAAVDAIVQNEIFNKCILGLLRNKTRILITHNPDIIQSKFIDQSIELLSEGKISSTANATKAALDEPLITPLTDRFLQETTTTNSVMTTAEVMMEGFTPLTKHQSSFIEGMGSSNATAGALVDEEARHEGRVSPHVFLNYFKAIGGVSICVFLLLVQVVWQVLQIGSDFWLSAWTSQDAQQQKDSMTWNISIYTALALGSAFMVFVRTMTISFTGVRGAKKLFDDMTISLLRAPMSFFDANPLGRQLNRYSDDVSSVDFRLPFALGSMLAMVFSVGASLLTAAAVMQYFGLIFVPILYIYWKVGSFYLSAARELQRITKVTQSPLLSHVSESIEGVNVIRAFGEEHVERFIVKNDAVVDKNNSVQFLSFASSEWYAMRVQMMGGAILIVITLGLVSLRSWMSAGIVGLIFNYGLMVDQGLESLIQIWSWVEMSMISPERIQEYIDIPSEAPSKIDSTEPDQSWPQEGMVQFKDVSFKYKEGGKLVLDGIDFEIQPKEKVGIVGRTGAGKSSLTMALFRINEVASGTIYVDGVDTKSLGLATLRGRLSIITQAPVLFKGTIRSYLDPFSEFSDEELWSSLRKVEMYKNVSTMEGKLEGVMEENGENFSVGERQLLCMARALLSRSKLVVMDEATASIDHNTDMVLQAVIRTEFKDSTVITIAHRLDTVLDSDRIMVLDAGKIVEFDSPKALIAKGKGHFFDLAKEGGYLERMKI